MKTFNQYISEKTETVNGVRMLVNPSRQQLMGMFNRSKYAELRGLVIDDKTMYWWDGTYKTHYEIETALGIEHKPFHRAYLNVSNYDGGITVSGTMLDTKTLQRHPSVRALRLKPSNKPRPSSAFVGVFEYSDINEAKSEHIGGVRLLISPTKRELIGFIKRSKYEALRGLIVDDKTVYWWDASEYIHIEVGSVLKKQGVLPKESWSEFRPRKLEMERLKETWMGRYFYDEDDDPQYVFVNMGKKQANNPYMKRLKLEMIEDPSPHARISRGSKVTTIWGFKEDEPATVGAVSEAKVEFLDVDGYQGTSMRGLRVLVNPGNSELLRFMENTEFKSARGLLAEDRTLLWWDAGEATHMNVKEALGIPHTRSTLKRHIETESMTNVPSLRDLPNAKDRHIMKIHYDMLRKYAIKKLNVSEDIEGSPSQYRGSWWREFTGK
jgi:hypothetical protein